jgi:hypothetical protein
MKLKHRLQKQVQNAVDKGLNGVEKLHLKIARMPFWTLEKLADGPAKKAEALAQRNIGSMYDSMRGLNERAGRWALILLDRGDKATTAAAGKAKKVLKSAKPTTQKARHSGNSQHAAT